MQVARQSDRGQNGGFPWVGCYTVSRSLSDLGLIYCGKAGFEQISRSFSLNSYGYSPQTIEKSASNRLSLATIA
jgi:hypothetical protein